jgi:hypothetical protein
MGEGTFSLAKSLPAKPQARTYAALPALHTRLRRVFRYPPSFYKGTGTNQNIAILALRWNL